MTAEANDSATEPGGVYCPSCGYDLRASIDHGRCPECGSEFDKEKLSRSRVPWMHRHELGWLKAWWRTCWMALWRPGDLAASLNAPMPYPDARRFWMVCAGLAAIPWVIGAWWSPETAGLPVPGLEFSLGPASAIPAWLGLNLYAPWAAGWYLRPVAMGCSALAVFAATGAVSYLFQFAPIPRRLQDRAAAAGLYATGAMIGGLAPAMLLVIAGAISMAAIGSLKSWGDTGPLVGVLALQIIIAWWVGVWRAYRRIVRAGVIRSILVAGAIPVMALLGILFAIGFVPWCIGVVRILVSALRV